MSDIEKEIMKTLAREKNSLVAQFLHRDVNLTPDDIELCQQTKEGAIRIWVERKRAEVKDYKRRALELENKSLQAQLTRLKDAIEFVDDDRKPYYGDVIYCPVLNKYYTVSSPNSDSIGDKDRTTPENAIKLLNMGIHSFKYITIRKDMINKPTLPKSILTEEKESN